MVWITAFLTPKGAKHPQAVVDVILTFLAHAKKGCSSNKLTSLAKSAKLLWDWPSPMDASKAASTIAESMTRLPPEELLSTDDLMDEPNQTRVLTVLEKLRPERMNVGLVTPDATQAWKRSLSVKSSSFSQDFREVFVVFVVEHKIRVRDAKVIRARLVHVDGLLRFSSDDGVYIVSPSSTSHRGSGFLHN